MAGRKLGTKAEEEVVWMEHVLMQLSNLNKKVEEYAVAKKNADSQLQPIVRLLQQIRQQGMIKNLGAVADSAGLLAVGAMRGSQMQRTRVLREGLSSFKQLIDRTMKATIDADVRDQARKHDELEVVKAADKAARAAAAEPAPAAKPEAAQ